MNKHILFISSWYPTPHKISHGIFFKRQAEAVALRSTVSAIHICSGNTDSIKTFEEHKVLTILGTYKKVKHTIPFISSAQKLWKSWLCFKNAYKQLLKHQPKPDLVLLNVIFPAGIFALWLSYCKQLPLLIQEQWSGYYPEDGNYRGFFTKLITQVCVSRARGILVVSDKLEANMKAHGLNNQYYKIGNVVNTSLFVPGYINNTDVFHFIHVSTVNDKEKNISGIIEAVRILSERGVALQMHIIGDGPERPYFEQLAQKYRLLNQSITFYGHKTPEQVAHFMSKAQCFVLNSHYEGLPCVILEAMSCGIPVIATKVGAVREIIQAHNGILIDSDNLNQLTEAMEQMIKNYAHYNKLNIRKTIENNFSYPAIAANFDDIFTEVLKK